MLYLFYISFLFYSSKTFYASQHFDLPSTCDICDSLRGLAHAPTIHASIHIEEKTLDHLFLVQNRFFLSMMSGESDSRKDLECIENCIKAAFETEPEIDSDKQISAVKTRSKSNDKSSSNAVEYEETLINIKDCYRIMKPMMQKAIMIAVTNIVERQDSIESNLLAKITQLENKVTGITDNFNDKLLDSKIRDDALEMYNRRDSIRIYGVPQTEAEKTNSQVTMGKVLETMKKIGLENNVKQEHISTSHRIHRKNKNNSFPDPIIVKLLARQTKDLIIGNSSKLRDDTTLNPRQFINEDLTPLRSKLLTYIKTKVPSVISKSVHSREGRILCKKTEDQSKWIYIESVRDLHKLNVSISNDLLKELDMDNCLINVVNV